MFIYYFCMTCCCIVYWWCIHEVIWLLINGCFVLVMDQSLTLWPCKFSTRDILQRQYFQHVSGPLGHIMAHLCPVYQPFCIWSFVWPGTLTFNLLSSALVREWHVTRATFTSFLDFLHLFFPALMTNMGQTDGQTTGSNL